MERVCSILCAADVVLLSLALSLCTLSGDTHTFAVLCVSVSSSTYPQFDFNARISSPGITLATFVSRQNCSAIIILPCLFSLRELD